MITDSIVNSFATNVFTFQLVTANSRWSETLKNQNLNIFAKGQKIY